MDSNNIEATTTRTRLHVHHLWQDYLYLPVQSRVNFSMAHMDVETAFMEAKLKEDIWLSYPAGLWNIITWHAWLSRRSLVR